MALRPYQLEAIEGLRNSIRKGKKSPLLLAATGSGKTVIATHIVKQAQEKNKRVWFICDNIELVEQTVATFEREGIECGVLQGIHEKTNITKPIQVATAQTLARRLEHIGNWAMPDMVIIDEAHVQYKAHKQVMERVPNALLIGLSATPWSKGLGKTFDDVVLVATTAELIEQGYLSPYHVFAGKKKADLSNVKTIAGDFAEDEAAEQMGKAEIVGDVVDTWFRMGGNRQTVLFAVNVAHSKALCAEFRLRDVEAVHIDGRTDKDERKQMISDYKAGKIKMLCTVGIATKGFDAPNTSCLILARPTKSLMLHFQMVGRGLRIAEGKEDCIILDHAGNFQRNGFVCDPIDTELCDGTKKEASKDRKKKEDPLPKECPKCGFMKQPKQHICPNCNFEPEKQNKVEEVEGDMVALQKKNHKETSVDDKQEFYSGLIAYANLKGYNSGWAYHKYREKFGTYPPNTFHKKAGEITVAVDSFITHLRIKNANSKGFRK